MRATCKGTFTTYTLEMMLIGVSFIGKKTDGYMKPTNIAPSPFQTYVQHLLRILVDWMVHCFNLSLLNTACAVMLNFKSS